MGNASLFPYQAELATIMQKKTNMPKSASTTTMVFEPASGTYNFCTIIWQVFVTRKTEIC